VDTLEKDLQAPPRVDIKVESSCQESRAEEPDATRCREIEELLRIKRERGIDSGRIPCPSCGLVIEITVNRCPFCESDIAAQAALARETTRRLKELSGEIESEHARRTEERPEARGFLERLKYLFAGDPEPAPEEIPLIETPPKRLLSMVSPGDTLKVLAEDGAWLQVKTSAGVTGWVYSTVRRDQ